MGSFDLLYIGHMVPLACTAEFRLLGTFFDTKLLFPVDYIVLVDIVRVWFVRMCKVPRALVVGIDLLLRLHMVFRIVFLARMALVFGTAL